MDSFACHCDKWAKDHNRNLALYVAGRDGYISFISVIYPEKTSEVQNWLRTAQFRNAVCDGDSGMVNDLLERDCEIDEVDSQGYSPWLWAVKEGHKHIVELLLHRNDIDFQRVHKAGRSFGINSGALHFAARARDTATMRVLLFSGKFDSAIDEKSLIPQKPTRYTRYATPSQIAHLLGDHETAKVVEDYQDLLKRESNLHETPNLEAELAGQGQFSEEDKPVSESPGDPLKFGMTSPTNCSDFSDP